MKLTILALGQTEFAGLCEDAVASNNGTVEVLGVQTLSELGPLDAGRFRRLDEWPTLRARCGFRQSASAG